MKEHVIKNQFSYFSYKTYVVGTQKTAILRWFFQTPKANVLTDG